MAKRVVGIVKGGEATPAPPLGPALGQKQIQIAAFVKDFNAKTSKMKGQLLNTYITVYEDKTYTFVTKGTSTSTLIKKKLGIENLVSLTKQKLQQSIKSSLKK